MTRSVWRGCANSWARKLVRSKGEMKIPHAVRHTWTVQRRHPRRQRSDAVCYYTMAFKVPTDSATDQSTKLLVGTRTSTLSVTGSIMVRNNQRAVQLGPCTKGFVPTNLAIFLDTGKYLSGTTSFSTKHGVLAAGSAWYHGAVAPNAFPGSIPFLPSWYASHAITAISSNVQVSQHVGQLPYHKRLSLPAIHNLDTGRGKPHPFG